MKFNSEGGICKRPLKAVSLSVTEGTRLRAPSENKYPPKKK